MRQGTVGACTVATLTTLALLGSLAPAAARTSTPAGNAPHTGEARADVLVKFSDDASAAERAAVRGRLGLEPVERVAATGAEVVATPHGTDARTVTRVLRADPSVVYAEPEADWFPASAVPDDPGFSQQWALDGQRRPRSDIRVRQAWQRTQGRREVVVAVVDTGVDIRHPDLADAVWTNTGEIPGNGIDDDGNGYVDDVHGWDFAADRPRDGATVFDHPDEDAHGTQVAGIIAAGSGNRRGVAGVAPRVRIMPLKFMSYDDQGRITGSTSDAIEAIEYARRHGADVINASWTGSRWSPALRDTIAASGVAFVAAAGNTGRDVDRYKNLRAYPASYRLPNLLSVAATDRSGALAGFSAYGRRSVDVAAPGADVLTTVPRPRPWRADPVGAVAVDGDGYRAIVLGFGLEDVATASTRRDLLSRALHYLRHDGGQPVIIVDADRSDDSGLPDMQDIYTGALSDAGIPYEETTTALSGMQQDTSPLAGGVYPATNMEGRTLVWQTGDATLSDEQRLLLRSFLEGGGNMLLTGPDALYDSDGSTLVHDYLHIADVADAETHEYVEGAGGTPFAGVSYRLSGTDRPAGPRSWRSVLRPRQGGAAVPALRHRQAYDYGNGTSMAAPHAAGVVALLASRRPDLDGTALARALAATSARRAKLTQRVRTGGQVDAARAVSHDYPRVRWLRVPRKLWGRRVISAGINPGSGVRRAELWIRGRRVGMISGERPTYRFGWNSRSVGNGRAHVEVRLVAGNGVRITASRWRRVANPRVRLRSPRQRATVSGRVRLRAQASAGAGVRRVDFYAAGRRVGRDWRAPYAVRWQSRTRRDGWVRVWARVVDRSGLAARSPSRRVRIRN